VVLMTSAFVFLREDNREERFMAERGLCWNYVPGGKAYTPCAK
jgi:hypothetical protein